MELRYKKTGEICLLKISEHGYLYIVTHEGAEGCQRIYNSLSELNEDCEDYEPVEPIIRDPKIRKVVRAWAEANNVHSVVIVSSGTLRCKQKGIDIEFNGSPFYGWTSATKTITELCGKEEE